MLTEKQSRLQEALDRLCASPGVKGVVLVSRDGFAMMNRYKELQAAETFSAMGATLVGAAEAAINEVATGAPQRVIVETATERMVAAGATAELLLMVVAESTLPSHELVERVDRCAQEVARLLSG